VRDLSINTELARQILVNFIRSEVTRVGYSRAVVGLSGGIDSALSCALAVEALGAENVLAVKMPYRSSSSDSLAHAELLIEQLEIPSKTIEITDMVEPLFALDENITKLRKGNIMPRAHGRSYDQSEAFKGLVIGTKQNGNPFRIQH
jgi:NAD+ synthase